MYTPSQFKEPDETKILEFIEQNSFAILVTTDVEKPIATHLPLMIERDAEDKLFLVGHMARANEQWKFFHSEREVLAIFAGAHAYISPRWYPAPLDAVPTWNYEAVHVYGKPRVTEDAKELRRLVEKLVEKFEASTDYALEKVAPEYIKKLLGGIVGFQIEVTKIEAAFKLSQHRPETHAGVIENLQQQTDENSRKIAAAMRRFGSQTDSEQ
jgi:transcriptional regulator